MDTAYFTKYPRTVRDLRGPRPLEGAAPYEITGTVILDKCVYDNFVSDMLVSRGFLENASGCLLIECEDRDSLLVLPETGGYVGFAACAIP
ncbi:MAG: hypothetical protein FWC62_07325 [Firmicutes bacterium]|nr:hypothetical protein [Bacillota bacterium]